VSERENILARIREALRLSAPLPGHHGSGNHAPVGPPRSAATEARRWLPPVGTSFDDQIRIFQTCATDLKAEFHLLPNLEALPAFLVELSASQGWKKAAVHSGPLADIATQALGLPVLHARRGYDVHEMESCDVGVSECDALVAQTGSVLVTSRSAGGRALSVLPPHHLVLARRDQLVPDLPAAFELLGRKYGGSHPSFISLITGPSRTGDIERILVLGAHGPKKLTIVCC
jgi:L-lactate dehydrogenase complex protein LldG